MTNTGQKSPTGPKDTTSEAKAAAASVSEEVKHRAQDVAGKVTDEAARQADKAKGAVAGEVKDVASALRTAANEMRDGSPQERTFSQIADGLADMSEAVRDKDLGEVVGSLNDFARRNPMVFLGGAALLGFAATRFAKASSDNPSSSASSAHAAPAPAVATTHVGGPGQAMPASSMKQPKGTTA